MPPLPVIFILTTRLSQTHLLSMLYVSTDRASWVLGTQRRTGGKRPVQAPAVTAAAGNTQSCWEGPAAGAQEHALGFAPLLPRSRLFGSDQAASCLFPVPFRNPVTRWWLGWGAEVLCGHLSCTHHGRPLGSRVRVSRCARHSGKVSGFGWTQVLWPRAPCHS